MPSPRAFQELRLVNGSTGDPALFVDDPGRDNALLIDCGENAALGDDRLGDLEAVFLTHHHVDHFIGFDRVVRANLDRDKALHVYGPAGTIGKIYSRIKSYEYPFFPFQKIVLEAHEVLPGRLRSARLECARRFPRPLVSEAPWAGPVVYRANGLSVEATFVDHTVPCLAFALVEEPGIFPDPDRLADGSLPAGTWVNAVRTLLNAAAPLDTPVAVPSSAGTLPLAELKARYFVETPGSRIAYVTDTAWSDKVRPALLRLAGGARQLYCDSFYAHAQRAQAEKHRHMTAAQAAEFAREAGVDQLIVYLEAIEQGPAMRFAFTNALAERILVRPDQLEGRLASEQAGDHAQAMQEYGLLKRIFEGLHRYEHQDWAFYRFKVNQRLGKPRSWRHPWSKLSQLGDWLLLDKGCGYGTSPSRAIRAAVLIILGFAVIYAAGIDWLHIEKTPFKGEPSNIANRCMIAALTTVSAFTSGFGDLRDAAQGWMNLPLIAESLLGTLLWGLFIVAFSRKVIR